MSDRKVALVVNDDHRVADWVPQRFADAGVTFVNHPCFDGEELARYAGDADVFEPHLAYQFRKWVK